MTRGRIDTHPGTVFQNWFVSFIIIVVGERDREYRSPSNIIFFRASIVSLSATSTTTHLMKIDDSIRQLRKEEKTSEKTDWRHSSSHIDSARPNDRFCDYRQRKDDSSLYER
jgi:hypothetical protein